MPVAIERGNGDGFGASARVARPCIQPLALVERTTAAVLAVGACLFESGSSETMRVRLTGFIR